MKTAIPCPACTRDGSLRTCGFALVTCLLLLTVFAVMAVAGFTAALVELRIASNVEQRERAFHAAEYGIEQALLTPDLAMSLTAAAPLAVPVAGDASIPVPDSTPDTYSYRLHFSGSTPSGLPPADPAALLTAFHFVIEAIGYSGRGGASTLVQSFRILRPAGWTSGPVACEPDDSACVALPQASPRRTSWLEAEAE
jgi:PilX N-terminal